MFIVQCALVIAIIWGPTGSSAVRAWDRNFGTEIHLLENSENAVYDRRTRRLVDTIEQTLELNGRLVMLFCSRQCYPARSQIPRWIREFSDQYNMTEHGEHFSYQFYDNRRNSVIFDDRSIHNGTKPYVVYAVDGRLFRYNGNVDDKEVFLSFLGSHELAGAETVNTWKELESIINTAQLCRGEKQIIQIVDNNRCPMRHYELVVRAFGGVVNYSFYDIMMPLTMDMYIELYTRLPELPFVCQLILLLQNNGYIWISADADVHELILAVERLQNTKCTSKLFGDWYPIREELTSVERDYLRAYKQSSTLESEPSYILVGATGGIAVVALAISIFWGLNGSPFGRQ